MSKNYGKVKGFYDAGLWSIGMVRNAVGRWITEAEYTELTGLLETAEEAPVPGNI